MNIPVLFAILTAVSFGHTALAANYEQDKDYLECKKSAQRESELAKCQEQLLERMSIDLAKTLEKNMASQTPEEKKRAQHYQFQWESWRQGHCDYSLREREDQQLLGLACYLQATQDRLDMLRGRLLESNQDFKVCLRRAGKIESHEIMCRQQEYLRLKNMLSNYVREAEQRYPQPDVMRKDHAEWSEALAKKCGKSDSFSSVEQAAAYYECISQGTKERIDFFRSK